MPPKSFPTLELTTQAHPYYITYTENIPASSHLWATLCAALPQFQFDVADFPKKTEQDKDKIHTILVHTTFSKV